MQAFHSRGGDTTQTWHTVDGHKQTNINTNMNMNMHEHEHEHEHEHRQTKRLILALRHDSLLFRSGLTFVCGIFIYGVTWILLGQESEEEITRSLGREFTVS